MTPEQRRVHEDFVIAATAASKAAGRSAREGTDEAHRQYEQTAHVARAALRRLEALSGPPPLPWRMWRFLGRVLLGEP